MDVEAGTASDRRRINRVGMTAAGLASATQLIDVTPFMTIRIDQSAVLHPLVIVTRTKPGGDAISASSIEHDDDWWIASLEDLEDWEAEHGLGRGDDL